MSHNVDNVFKPDSSSVRRPRQIDPTEMTHLELETSGDIFNIHVPRRPSSPHRSDSSPAIQQEDENETNVHSTSGSSSSSGMILPLPSNTGILEACLKFDFYFGLTPFKLTADHHHWVHTLGKVLFVVWHAFAFMDALIKICFYKRVSKWNQHEEDDTHGNMFWYVSIGYRLLIIALQCRHIQLLWWNRKTISDMLQNMKSSANANNLSSELNPTWGAAIAFIVRTLSTFIQILYSLLGVGILLDFKDWSFYNLLVEHSDNIELAFTSDSHYNNSLMSSANNSTTAFSSADDDTPKVKVILLGTLGLIFSISSRVVTTCAQDFLLLSTLAIWVGVRKQNARLQHHLIAAAGKQKTTGQGQAQNYRNLKQDAEELLTEHENLCELSNQTNSILHYIQPSLMLTNVVMMSSFLFSCMRNNVLGILLGAPRVFRLGLTFYFALDISDHKDKFDCWLSSKRARELLGVEASLLQIQTDGIMPLGIGKSIYYLDTRFVASFCGIIISYFLFVAEVTKPSRDCQS